MSFVIVFNQIVLTQEHVKSKRVKINGPFIVCSNGHFIHKRCPELNFIKKYLVTECPSCKDTNLIKVSTAIFDLKEKRRRLLCNLSSVAYTIMIVI